MLCNFVQQIIASTKKTVAKLFTKRYDDIILIL